MAKKKTRRSYKPEFKAEAANLVLKQGMTKAEAARSLGVAESLIGRWVRAAEAQAAPGALTSEEREELKRLRRENKVLRTEREILKNGTQRAAHAFLL